MGRSQDLSYFHKEFITAGGNALARRDNDKKRTGMMMGGGMKTSGSQPSYAHGANGGMGGPL